MTDLGSKTTLRVMVILRGQLQANHSLPNGGGQVGADAGYFQVQELLPLGAFSFICGQ